MTGLMGSVWILDEDCIDKIPDLYPARTCRIDDYSDGMVHLIFDTDEDMLLWFKELMKDFSPSKIQQPDSPFMLALRKNVEDFQNAMNNYWLASHSDEARRDE